MRIYWVKVLKIFQKNILNSLETVAATNSSLADNSELGRACISNILVVDAQNNTSMVAHISRISSGEHIQSIEFGELGEFCWKRPLHRSLRKISTPKINCFQYMPTTELQSIDSVYFLVFLTRGQGGSLNFLSSESLTTHSSLWTNQLGGYTTELTMISQKPKLGLPQPSYHL